MRACTVSAHRLTSVSRTPFALFAALLLTMSFVGSALVMSTVSATPQWRVAKQSLHEHYVEATTGRRPMKLIRYVDGKPEEISHEDAEQRISDDEIRLRREKLEEAGIDEEELQKWRF